jgi:hypothetical protein
VGRWETTAFVVGNRFIAVSLWRWGTMSAPRFSANALEFARICGN